MPTQYCKARGDIPSLLNTDLPIKQGAFHSPLHSNIKILSIDGADAISNKVTAQFDVYGAVVKRAHSITESLTVLEKFQPTAILLDIKLRSEDGLALVPHLRKSFPESKIVVHTSYGDTSLAAWAVKMGADEFVAKPTDADLLFDILIGANGKEALSDRLSNPFSLRLRYIFETLKSNQFNISKTAKVLKLKRTSLTRMLKTLRDRQAIHYM